MMKKTPSQYCPLCTQENMCAIDEPSNCWCMNKDIPKPLIDNLPSLEKGQRCICQSCIDKFKLDVAITS